LVLCATCPAAMAGPAWLAPVQISPQGDVASSPEIAVDPQGDAIVIFSDNTNSGPQTVFRPAGGTFEPPQTLSPSGVTPEIAMDSNGNAAAAWWVGPD